MNALERLEVPLGRRTIRPSDLSVIAGVADALVSAVTRAIVAAGREE